MLVKTLGETVKNRRKELSITQPHLAELVNISTNTLHKIERGQANPINEVNKREYLLMYRTRRNHLIAQ